MNLKYKYILAVMIWTIFTSSSCTSLKDNSDTKLINFPPTNLAIYAPMDTLVYKKVYDGPENYEVFYDINYKGQKINFNIFSQLRVFDSLATDSIALPHINSAAKLVKVEYGNKISSTAYLDLSKQGSSYDDVLYYRKTINYYSSKTKKKNFGDEFIKLLFINTNKYQGVEPDSLIYNGPYEVYIPYFDANSAVIPSRYYEDDKLKHFASFVSRNNANIIIEGHTSKNEVQLANRGEDYSLSLSRQRAEAFKDFLIENYDMDPNIQVDIQAKGNTRPVAPDSNTEAVKKNHRVRAYIDLRSPEK